MRIFLFILLSAGQMFGQGHTLLDLTVGQPATGLRVGVPTPPISPTDFSMSPSSGAWPLTVQFIDLTQGGPAAWAWNFGDGFTSTAQNPTHTYQAPGTFTITFQAQGPGGTGYTNHTITVTNPTCPPAITVTVNQSVTLTGKIRSQGLVYDPLDNMLFMCTRSTPASIIQWSNLNNLSLFTAVALPADGLHDRCQDMTYDATTGKLLATFQHTGSTLVSTIDPVVLTVTDVVNDVNSQNTYSICSDGVFAYFDGADPSDNTMVLHRYAMSNWTSQGRMRITNCTAVGALRFDGTNLYGDSSSTGGSVYRVNLPGLTFATNQPPAPYGLLTDDLGMYGNYFYCGSENASAPQGAILRVKKDDLSITTLTNCVVNGTSFGIYYDLPNVGNPYLGLVWDTVPLSPSTLVGLDPITSQMWSAGLPSLTAMNEIVSDGIQMFTTTWQDPPTVSRIGVTRQPVPIDVVVPAGFIPEPNSNVATHLRWNGVQYGGFMMRTGNALADMFLYLYDAQGHTNILTLTGMNYSLAGAHADFAFMSNTLVCAGAPAATTFSNASIFEYSITAGNPLPTGLTLVTNFMVGNSNFLDAVVTPLSSGAFAVGFSAIRTNALNVSYRSPSGTWTNLGNIPIGTGGGAAPYIAAAQMGGTSNWWTLQNWDGGGQLYATEWTTSGNALNKSRDFLLCNNQAFTPNVYCWGLQAPYGENCIMEMTSDTVSNRLLVTYQNEHFSTLSTLFASTYPVVCGLLSGVTAFTGTCGSVDTNNFYLIGEADTAPIDNFTPLGMSQSGTSMGLGRLEWTDAAFNFGVYPLDMQISHQSPFSPSQRIKSSFTYNQIGYAEHRYDLLYQDFSDQKWHLLIGL